MDFPTDFQSGDYVVNTYPNGPRPESEVQLVCHMREDTWWACDMDGKLCTVDVGYYWIHNKTREIRRRDMLGAIHNWMWMGDNWREFIVS